MLPLQKQLNIKPKMAVYTLHLYRTARCQNVKGTIIVFEEKIDDVDYSVCCKNAAVC